MQFLRQQRKDRKRKTYLEKIQLADKIQSVNQFNATYELLQKLQTGGQGSVYSIRRKLAPSDNNIDDEKQEPQQLQTDHDDELEGNETKQETELVVKILSLSDMDDTKTALINALCQYELLQKAQLLRHKGIYYDDYREDLLIVTERLHSNLSEMKHSLNIFDLDNGGKANEELLRSIICDVLHSLHVLHSKYFLHCDINPSNIMKDLDGNYRLIDYDMMMAVDEKRGYVKDCWKGTVGWVAAEIGHDIESADNTYSFATDLWSIGLCLLYLLNGFQNPFDLTKQEIEDNQLNDEATKLEYYYKYKMNEETHQQVLHLLIAWFVDNKISWNLYDLLVNHLLVFDVTDRCKSCADVITHSWFSSYIKANGRKYPSFDTGIAEEGEILAY